jgi:hypothetical protein
MKRSMVTTDVAVCLTTLIILEKMDACDSFGRIQSRRGVRAGVDLEAIPNIATTRGLPKIENRKRRKAGFKLVDVEASCKASSADGTSRGRARSCATG